MYLWIYYIILFICCKAPFVGTGVLDCPQSCTAVMVGEGLAPPAHDLVPATKTKRHPDGCLRFVLYRQIRCHPEKVNKINGFEDLRAFSCVDKIDAELFMVLSLSFAELFLLSFSLIFCNIYTAFLCTQHLRRLEKQA